MDSVGSGTDTYSSSSSSSRSSSSSSSSSGTDMADGGGYRYRYSRHRDSTLSEKLSSHAFQRLALFFAMTCFTVNFYIGTVEQSLGENRERF